MSRVAEYCKCGSLWEGEVRPESAAKIYRDAFWQAHTDPECGPTTKSIAAKAYRENNRRAASPSTAKESEQYPRLDVNHE